MIAVQERLDPTSPEHLRRARILAETLIACTGYMANRTEDISIGLRDGNAAPRPHERQHVHLAISWG